MRLYAFAALLALPFLGFATASAEAGGYDNDCCGGYQHQRRFEYVRWFYVPQDAVVYGCDGYHCETGIRLLPGIKVKAGCRNGWCQLLAIWPNGSSCGRDACGPVGLPLKEVWVLERCLQPADDDYGRNDDNDEGDDR